MTAHVLSQQVKSARRQGDCVLAFLRLTKLGCLAAGPNGIASLCARSARPHNRL